MRSFIPIVPGKFEECPDYREKGQCICCGKNNEGQIFFLPGELEYLNGIDRGGYYPLGRVNFIGRCKYVEQGNCPERPYFCRLFPLFPVIDVTMILPVSFLVNHDCPLILNDFLVWHRLDILNSIHYLLSNWPDLIYWFLVPKDKYQDGDKLVSPVLRAIDSTRETLKRRG